MTGINAQLRNAITISGTVTDEIGNPLENVVVDAYSPTINTYQDTTTAVDGTYTLGNLAPATDWVVGFRSSGFPPTYGSEYYDDALLYQDADPLTLVEGGDLVGIDASLVELGSVTGTVTGPGGIPLPNIPVQVLLGGTFNSYGVGYGYAETDANGDYEVTGVRPGESLVLFGEAFGWYGNGAAEYRSEWWNDTLNPAAANDVVVASGTATTGVDAQLELITTPEFHGPPSLTNTTPGSDYPTYSISPPATGPTLYGYSVAVDNGRSGDGFQVSPFEPAEVDLLQSWGQIDDQVIVTATAVGPDGSGAARRTLVTLGSGPDYAVTPAVSLSNVTTESAELSWSIPSGPGVEEWFYELRTVGTNEIYGQFNDIVEGDGMLTGSATVEGLQPGTTYDVFVSGYNFDPFSRTFFGTTVLQTDEAPAPELRVIATDVEASAPSEGATVSVIPAGGGAEVANGTTGVDGVLELDLAPGTYEVSVDKTGFSTYREEVVIDGSALVEVAASLYPARSSVSGTVLDGDAQVISCSDVDSTCPEVTASLVGAGFDYSVSTRVSETDGSYSLSGLWEGDWQVEAALTGYESPAPAAIELVRDDEAIDVDFVLEPLSLSAVASNVSHSTMGRQVTVDLDVALPTYCTDGYLFVELVPAGAEYDEGLGFDIPELGWQEIDSSGPLQLVFEAPSFDEFQLNFSSISVQEGECASGPDNLTAPHLEYLFEVEAPAAPEVARLAGSDRFATSAEVAKEYEPFSDGEGVVYVANGLGYPDALSAAPAAAFRGAPLLLTLRDSLPASVRAQIVRLSPEVIVIAGGAGVVSAAVETELRTLAPTVERHAGSDRYETSRVLTQNAFGEAGALNVFLATGRGFPDALAASAAAGRFAAPVVLVDGAGSSVPQITRDLLTDLGAEQLFIAGGSGVVSEAIRTSLSGVGFSVTRLSGPNRYATSEAINNFSFATSQTVFLAVGTGYADALAGAALAGNVDAPLFVVPGNCVPQGVLDQIADLGATEVRLLGGAGSLSANVANLTRC